MNELYRSPDGSIILTEDPGTGYTIARRGVGAELEAVSVLPEYWTALTHARQLCGMTVYQPKEEA